MSVSVISEPGLLSFSKNPCEFHLRSDAWIVPQPVTGVYELTFTNKLATLFSTLTLSWNGNTVVFYVESTTNPTGYNLPQDIAATTLAQYVEQIAETWFDAQFLLQKDFIIEYDAAGPLVRFTAREPGTELALTYSTTIPPGEATMATATTPIAWNYLDDYAIIMDIEVEEIAGSGELTRIGTLHGSPILYDDAGTWKGDVKIDVAELLDGFLQDRTDAPALGIPTAQAANNTILTWRAVWAERFTVAGEVVFVRRAQSSAKKVLKGGLKYLDVPAIGDIATNFYQVTDKPFNTWQPQNKEVTADEPHFLYFLTDFLIFGGDYFELLATVYYTDGTTDSSIINSSVLPQPYQAYCWRVGFVDEGLNLLQPAKTPYKYSVQMVANGGGMASEVRTFKLVDKTRQDRFFLYENSVGGAWETLRCNGDMEALATVDKTEALNVVQAGYTRTDAVVQQKSQGYEDSFTVFTGYKTKAEAIHLREFINSENYYEIIDNTKVPIVVDAGSFKLEYDKTGEYAYGLSFKYRHAFINKGYSNA